MLHSSNPHSSSSDQLPDESILDSLGDSLGDAERIEYQDAIASLTYDAPEMPLNPNLKNRLFENLGLDVAETDILSLLNLSMEELKCKANSLTWENMPEAPGFDMAIWQEREASRMMACFIRAENPASFPNHYHPADEVILVLGGDLVEQGQVFTEGDRLNSPSNSSHQLDTTQGCLLFCIASMDNRFESA